MRQIYKTGLSTLALAIGLMAGSYVTNPTSVSALATATDPAPVTGTTVGSWSFNQASGTTVTDNTGRGHTGTIDPMAPSFGFVKDTALNRYVGNFPTENGRIIMKPSSDLSPGSSNFGFGISFKTTDIHSNIFQAGTSQPDTNFIKFEMAGATGQPRCRFIGSTGTFALMGKTTLADGKWHSVRCDKYSDRVTMRIDGVLAISRKVTLGSINVANEVWSIGGKYTPRFPTNADDTFKGTLKDAFIVIAR